LNLQEELSLSKRQSGNQQQKISLLTTGMNKHCAAGPSLLLAYVTQLTQAYFVPREFSKNASKKYKHTLALSKVFLYITN